MNCLPNQRCDADLPDDLGVGERTNVANVHGVGDGGKHAAHDFARARLGHVGIDTNTLGPRDFADHSLDHVNDLVFNGLVVTDKSFQLTQTIRESSPRLGWPTNRTGCHRRRPNFRQARRGSALFGFPAASARLMAFAQIDLMKTLDSLAHGSIGNLEDSVLYFRFRQPQRAIREIS